LKVTQAAIVASKRRWMSQHHLGKRNRKARSPREKRVRASFFFRALLNFFSFPGWV
jgi:hypothetical protein